VFIETDGTDLDAGLKVLLGGEPWSRAEIFAPDGRSIYRLRPKLADPRISIRKGRTQKILTRSRCVALRLLQLYSPYRIITNLLLGSLDVLQGQHLRYRCGAPLQQNSPPGRPGRAATYNLCELGGQYIL
jgi:hypothetical protein